MKSLKMKSLIALVVALVMLMSSSAMACTAIYVGSGLTADGSTMFARSEDISNSYNKLFYFAPAGTHKAGDGGATVKLLMLLYALGGTEI